MKYGSKTVMMLDDAGTGTIQETKYRGSKVHTVTVYRESVKIKDEPQLLAEILKHLEACKVNEWHDPSFEMFTDRQTGTVNRLVRSRLEASQ